jgi:indole-3-glycerol phosphate synthase
VLPGILATIVARKLEEVAELRKRASELERAAAVATPRRDLKAALRREGQVALVAECKRRSPGAGEIRPDLDPVALSRGYEAAGAAALSVLTDGPFFGGSAEDLRRVRESVDIPLLRKDFILDPIQVTEAGAIGADAVLLIARILDDASLRRLVVEVRSRGMVPLVEAHDAIEVDRALAAGAPVLGINNRDLSTFGADLETTFALLEGVPDDVVVVSESGIRNRDDVRRLGDAGVDAILVGEALLRSGDPAAAARSLVGVSRSSRACG